MKYSEYEPFIDDIVIYLKKKLSDAQNNKVISNLIIKMKKNKIFLVRINQYSKNI